MHKLKIIVGITALALGLSVACANSAHLKHGQPRAVFESELTIVNVEEQAAQSPGSAVLLVMPAAPQPLHDGHLLVRVEQLKDTLEGDRCDSLLVCREFRSRFGDQYRVSEAKICTGAFVTEHEIVTASHCLAGTTWKRTYAVIGYHADVDWKVEGGQLRVPLSKVGTPRRRCRSRSRSSGKRAPTLGHVRAGRRSRPPRPYSPNPNPEALGCPRRVASRRGPAELMGLLGCTLARVTRAPPCSSPRFRSDQTNTLMPAYLSNPPPGVERLDPSTADIAQLLRAIESANPAPLERVWEKQGRRRIPRLEGVCAVGDAQFLHVPWLRQPQRGPNQVVWYALAGIAAIGVGAGVLLLGRLFYAVAASGATFTAVVGAGYTKRSNDSRRAVVSDGGGGLPGFICLADRLLIRYPDALYQLPRAQIRSIAQHARGRAEGDNAMAEYEMTAEIDGGGGPVTAVAIAEVVELQGHQKGDDTVERLAVLLALAVWLDQVWRPTSASLG